MNKKKNQFQCVESLLKSNIASTIEEMKLNNVFELGVSIGCEHENSINNMSEYNNALTDVFEVT